MVFVLANSADPEEISHSTAFHFGFQCDIYFFNAKMYLPKVIDILNRKAIVMY